MKTQKQVLEANRQSGCIDGRDFARLLDFFPVTDWSTLGYSHVTPPVGFEPKEWTEENVRVQLERDVAFGFVKAIDQRGISSSLMYQVVKMWMWVLDDPLESFDTYAQYGLPLFKAVAVKYGFENPIGEHTGSESCYAEDDYRYDD